MIAGSPRIQTGAIYLSFIASVTSAVLSGCGSVPEEGSLASLKQDQRKTLVMQCRQQPERYGFPYTREEYMLWRRDVGRWMPELDAYCMRIARALVE